MNGIVKVAEGAYFVPSYSDQTVIAYQPTIGSQSVLNARDEEGPLPSTQIPLLPSPEVMLPNPEDR